MEVFKNSQLKSYILIFGIFILAVLIVNFTVKDSLLSMVIISIGTTSILFSTHSKQRTREIIFEDNIIIVKKYISPFKLVQEKYFLSEVSLEEDKKVVGEFSWAKCIQGKNKLGKILFVISTEFALWEEDMLTKIIHYYHHAKRVSDEK